MTAPGGWLPIESAPKDGTEVLVWQVNPFCGLPGSEHEGSRRPAQWWGRIDGSSDWLCSITGEWIDDVTLWQPLPPEPPA